VITPASLTAFEILVKPFHDGHVVVHFVARFVAQYREKSEVTGVIRVKPAVISIACPDRDAGKWCPHTELIILKKFFYYSCLKKSMVKKVVFKMGLFVAHFEDFEC